jgi:hypothetical protein
MATNSSSPPQPPRGRLLAARLAAGLLGLAMLVPAYRLWQQEGQNDVAVLVAEAQIIDPQRPPTSAVGSLVTATGALQTDAPIGDHYLKPGSYVTLERRVEMFAWQELPAGSSDAGATYAKRWSLSPSPSEGFVQPEGHGNPPRRLANERMAATSVRIGRIVVPRPTWQPERLPLKAEQVQGGTLHDGYVYPAGMVPGHPRLGDERIAYWGVAAGGPATAIGMLDRDGKLQPYADHRTRRYGSNGGTLYEVVQGDRAQALAHVATTFPTRANWSRRLQLLGWLFMVLVCWRYTLRR